MLAHSFFTGPGTYIPEFLPESALRDPPVFPTAQLGDGIDVRKLIARIDNEVRRRVRAYSSHPLSEFFCFYSLQFFMFEIYCKMNLLHSAVLCCAR